MKTVFFTDAAAKDFDALPAEGRQQVEYGLIRYATSGEGDVKRLSGREGFRPRVGRYRGQFDEDQKTREHGGSAQTGRLSGCAARLDLILIEAGTPPKTERMTLPPPRGYGTGPVQA